MAMPSVLHDIIKARYVNITIIYTSCELIGVVMALDRAGLGWAGHLYGWTRSRGN